MARAAIVDMRRAGVVPWWSVGAGFICARCAAESFSGPAASPEIRVDSSEVAAERGIPFLHDELMQDRSCLGARASSATISTESCARSKSIGITGIPISVHQERASLCRARVLTLLTIALEVPRAQLYETINRALRCDDRRGFRRGGARAARRRLQSRAAAAQHYRLSRDRGVSVGGEMTLESRGRPRQAQDPAIREAPTDLVSP